MRISVLTELPESVMYSLPRQEIDRLDVTLAQMDASWFDDAMDDGENPLDHLVS